MRTSSIAFLACLLQWQGFSDAFTTSPIITTTRQSSVFITPNNVMTSKSSLYSESSSSYFFMNEKETSEEQQNLEIVLFGIGDLRVSDHGGLHAALSSSLKNPENTQILPLLILSTDDTIVNLPGVPSYTLNTATMVSTAIASLSQELKSQYNLDLEIHSGQSISQVMTQLLGGISKDTFSSININVCDLGEADNQMGYHPYPHVVNAACNNDDSILNQFNIQPWSCRLRENPWDILTDETKDTDALPNTFPDYSKLFCQPSNILTPLDSITTSNAKQYKLKGSNTNIPTVQTMLSLFETSLNYLSSDESNLQSKEKQIQQSQNSGLFGTHWGGVHDSICTENDALECLNQYTQVYQSNDNQFINSDYYQTKLNRNEASLEHASLSWMMRSKNNPQQISGDNIILGEVMTRYLAAPLFLGCISKRQIYQAGKNAKQTTSLFSFGTKPSILQDFIEHREWQDLFAAKNILNKLNVHENQDAGALSFHYWRWHGFLCRYAVSDLLPSSSEETSSSEKSSIVLVHGFGASSAQWARAVAALAAAGSSNQFQQALAPDLIGFGQCEKPALSYTQYLWESYASSFVKDIVLQKYKSDEFVIGGNSIGGYTAMACAADDTLLDLSENNKVSGSGAPGTGKCQGLVLMNSAGMILTQEDVDAKLKKEADKGITSKSVAELTRDDLLGPCR